MINKYGRSIIPEKDCPRWQVYLPSFYMKLKNGHKGISADTLYRITEALGTNSDYILFREYRGSVETEIQKILSLFDEAKKETVLEILRLLSSFQK